MTGGPRGEGVGPEVDKTTAVFRRCVLVDEHLREAARVLNPVRNIRGAWREAGVPGSNRIVASLGQVRCEAEGVDVATRGGKHGIHQEVIAGRRGYTRQEVLLATDAPVLRLSTIIVGSALAVWASARVSTKVANRLLMALPGFWLCLSDANLVQTWAID